MKIITETGFIGFFLFFVLIFTIFRQTHSAFLSTADPFHRGLAMGYLSGFISLLFHAIGANTFIIVRIMEPFWFMTGMVMMIPQVRDET